MEQVPWSRFDWLNAPPSSSVVGSGDLLVITGNETDFWRPSSGESHDSGHFFGTPLRDVAAAELQFGGDFSAEFDQAGLMIRASQDVWLKAGVELADGALQASVVVTVGRSDWSVAPLAAPAPDRISVRASLTGEEVLIAWASNGGPFRLLRVTSLALGPATLVGPYCCSPRRSGLHVRYTPLLVEPRR